MSEEEKKVDNVKEAAPVDTPDAPNAKVEKDKEVVETGAGALTAGSRVSGEGGRQRFCR